MQIPGHSKSSRRGPGIALQSRFSSPSCSCHLNSLCCHHTKFLSGLRTDPSLSGLQAPYMLLTRHIGFPSLHLWLVLPSRSSLVREWKRWSLKHSVFTAEAIIISCQSWSFCIVQVQGSAPYPRPQTHEAPGHCPLLHPSHPIERQVSATPSPAAFKLSWPITLSAAASSQPPSLCHGRGRGPRTHCPTPIPAPSTHSHCSQQDRNGVLNRPQQGPGSYGPLLPLE